MFIIWLFIILFVDIKHLPLLASNARGSAMLIILLSSLWYNLVSIFVKGSRK